MSKFWMQKIGFEGEPNPQGLGDGKTPTVEELLAQMKEKDEALKKKDEEFQALNTRVTEQSAQVDRLTQLLEAQAKRGDLPKTEAGQRKLAKDYAALYNIPNEAVMEMLETAVSWAKEDLRAEWNQAEQLRALRDQFYGDNPELKPHAKIVQAINNDIAQKNPHWTISQVLAETAKQSKEYIIKIKKDGAGAPPNDPPPVLPGNNNKSGSGQQTPDPVLTPEQDLDAELKERRERQARASTRA